MSDTSRYTVEVWSSERQRWIEHASFATREAATDYAATLPTVDRRGTKVSPAGDRTAFLLARAS